MGKLITLGIIGFGLHSISIKTELDNHPLLKGRSKLVAGYDPDPIAIEMFKRLRDLKLQNLLRTY